MTRFLHLLQSLHSYGISYGLASKFISGAFIYIKMKKILSIIATIILAGTVLFNGQECSAQEALVQFEAIGGTVKDDFINSTNTGFEISGTILEDSDFDHAKLFIEGVEQVQQPPLTEGGYSIMRTGMSLDDLKVLFPEGGNQIVVSIYDSVGGIIDSKSVNITADYTLSDPVLVGVISS